MTENDRDGNEGKKQKGQCDLSLSHTSSASFIENNSRHGDWGGADRLDQNAILDKNVDKAVFGSDLMTMNQETRSIRSRTLSKEEIDIHMIIAIEFYDLLKKNSNQLAILPGAIMK